MSRPQFSRRGRQQPRTRINNRIRAREVRVVAGDGKQLGVMPTHKAIQLAKSQGVDLVAVAATAQPPVCRIIDYGRYSYEQSKKEKEAKKHQHANKVKEVQLRPNIDPHDFAFKLQHAIDFLCEDMKVKVNLRFRGRENAHKEVGMDTMNRFVEEIAKWGHADMAPKLQGRAISVMISPHPKGKRAENPNPKETKHDHEKTKKDRKHEDDEDSDDRVDTEAGSKDLQNPAFENLNLD